MATGKANAKARKKAAKPMLPGLHARLEDFDMCVALVYVAPDGQMSVERIRRMGMQRDTPETAVMKLRHLAKWIEEHTS